MIDLDANAGAPLDPRVRAALSDLLGRADDLGNPSSLHRRGQHARAVVEDARGRVAAALGAEPLEVTFTSGGTEADALAVSGSIGALRAAGRPHGLLTSPLEHPAVSHAAAAAARDGVPVHWIEVDAGGRIDPVAVADAVRRHPEVGVVSLSAANHELGNRYDVAAIVRAIRDVRPEVRVHTDAVQAFGRVEVDFCGWGVDLLSVSSHKVGGPAGAGALVHRKTLAVRPLWSGGQHERGRRPGTEPLLAVHGFGTAAELAATEREQRAAHVKGLRDRMIAGLERLGARIHGDTDANVGNTVNAAFEGCDGQLLLMALDLEGFAVSNGAACSSGSVEPSPVLLALGQPPATAKEAVRFSFGPHNDPSHVDAVLTALPDLVERIRAAPGSGARSAS